ncbi:MAG: hypothetical protein IJ748_04260 [Bacteroidales bacterium]|nr:hypothetical protein [Bacteroidales bacterium]
MANLLKKYFSGETVFSYIGRNIPFILYIVLLLIFYISSRYNVERTVKDISELSKDISELQKHYQQVKTNFQRTTQMTYIDSKLESTGVGISKEPIMDIIIYNDSIK